jgi:hypothetical protein
MFLVVFFFLRNFVQSIKIFAKMKKMTTKKAAPRKVEAKKAPVKKYRDGGPTGKKKSNPKSYWEGDSGNRPVYTNVEGPNNYNKTIKFEGGNQNKPYTMTVTKGGKTNQFQLTEEQAKNQRSIAKKEAGFKKGGTAKPKAMYGKTVKPTMMKKGGTTKKSK